MTNIQNKVRESETTYFKYSIPFQLEVQKQYLFYSLIELEQKLLADNVFQIIGSVGQDLIKVQMIRHSNPIVLKLNELRKWNQHRENSVFKIHKAGFKHHTGYYSYNVC